MRLLNTTTLQVEEFVANSIPLYAILSHTWGANEVTMHDLQCCTEGIKEYAGYVKIKKCSEQAASDGFKYIWCDTCCIDKANSTELSEAINSMFRWYQNAAECYAYLSDVENSEDFAGSRWFTRGWTLQELIAPLSVVFFDRHWNDIGTKASLRTQISTITGIPGGVLLKKTREDHCVAQIMSWAAKRQTTRAEDIAYCLLGLFDVHMPMIYGEGTKAFLRLQHELLKQSNDQSLFAWTALKSDVREERGPFAESPAEFARCGGIRRLRGSEHSEYSLTNTGLRITLPIIGDWTQYKPVLCKGYLNCVGEFGMRLGIYLLAMSDEKNRLIDVSRTRCKELCRVSELPTSPGLGPGPSDHVARLHQIYIESPDRNLFDALSSPRPQNTYRLTIMYNEVTNNGFALIMHGQFGGPMLQIEEERIRLHNPRSSTGLLFIHGISGVRFVVMIGIHQGTVWSDIETETGIGANETLLEIIESYYVSRSLLHERRTRAVYDGLDRINKPIGDGTVAKVIIRNKIVRGRKIFAVSITTHSVTSEIQDEHRDLPSSPLKHSTPPSLTRH